MSEPADPTLELLASLSEAGVEFIVVGGAAAVLQGVPITTVDLDIVHRRSPENIARLSALLQRLDATFRFDLANRRLAPRPDDLSGHGHLNLQTSYGELDVLCELAGARGYEALLEHTDEVLLNGRPVRVLNLPMLIEVKAAAGRPKDRLALPVLIATLEERSKK
jgi:hypothetical protein